ncbi:MAG TPA: hypothetical protein DDZ51_10780 [Planctomycetaceae bacterium]|nr:hypothetical protein [Planctomycetaceae bacterium]
MIGERHENQKTDGGSATETRCVRCSLGARAIFDNCRCFYSSGLASLPWPSSWEKNRFEPDDAPPDDDPPDDDPPDDDPPDDDPMGGCYHLEAPILAPSIPANSSA